jgi:hypothetical protein
MKLYTLTLASLLSASIASAQTNIAKLVEVPKQYTVAKTAESLTIDGKDTENAWKNASLLTGFMDIEGGEKKIPYSTQAKMLWNDSTLFIYAELEQPETWATLKEQDQSIFSDHALEMFIDPDGDGHGYVEFQINAFAAVWDLIMAKPYRNGGASNSNWDIKGLKKAIYVNGTLNVPGDKDKFWGIELAIPFKSIAGGRTFTMRPGTIWRMTFARVDRETELVDGKYTRKRNAQGGFLPPSYTTWTSQGLVNLHFPERWGYVQFAAEPNQNPAFLNMEDMKAKLELWKYYYAEQDFKTKNGKYATSIDQLKQAFPDVSFTAIPGLKLIGTELQFVLQAQLPSTKNMVNIDHESKITETVVAASNR